MSFTTGTTNYGLPQYVGTDTPSWTDFNTPFASVDAALGGAVSTVSTQGGKITTLETKVSGVGGLEERMTAAEGNITTLDGTVSGHTTSIATNASNITDVRNDLQDNITANNEASATSTHAYAIGDYFIYNDVLYQATAAIAISDTIVPNTNCAATNVTTEIAELNTDLNNVKDRLSDKSTIGAPVSLTNNVTFTVPSDGYVRINDRGVISFSSSYTPDSPTPLVVNRTDNSTGAMQRVAVFVRKGMNVIWTNEAGDSGACAFFPLTD